MIIENIIRERFKVFQKLISNGYNTDNKIITLKVEELIQKTNFNRSELVIAIGIKNALSNKKLITFLCGIEDIPIKGERKDGKNELQI